jgi:hypothetical protein
MQEVILRPVQLVLEPPVEPVSLGFQNYDCPLPYIAIAIYTVPKTRMAMILSDFTNNY